MFTHILVPLDGSRMAEAALPAASFLARQFGAIVTLFHVIEKHVPHEVHGQAHLQDAGGATAYLRKAARQAFPDAVRVDFHVHTTEAENVAESIVDHATELDHDLIIMCSHGRGQALHLFLGSIAQKVISKGSLPVLMTHPGKDEQVPEFSCTTLLLPLDGEPDHEQSLPVSRELARACSSLIHLVVVIPGLKDLTGERAATSRLLPGTTSKILEISVDNAMGYLHAQVETLRSEGLEAIAHVLRGEPSALIDESAHALHADLVVMATHGKSGMKAFWEGSMANKVCSRSKVPQLLIPIAKR